VDSSNESSYITSNNNTSDAAITNNATFATTKLELPHLPTTNTNFSNFTSSTPKLQFKKVNTRQKNNLTSPGVAVTSQCKLPLRYNAAAIC
jgi:hypothetical protein